MIHEEDLRRYALDNFGNRVPISCVNESSRHSGYKCVYCGGEMIPVLGKKRVHHFRHKTDACSYESYIHELWKHYVYEQWHNLQHIRITYLVENYCGNSEKCKLKEKCVSFNCNKSYTTETIDLKEKYDTCKIEGVYKDYRADILLSNSSHPEIIPTFIEICYKHACEEQKQNSGIPIIELKVSNDELISLQSINESAATPSLKKGATNNVGVIIYGIDRLRPIKHNLRHFYAYQDEFGVIHGKFDERIISCQNINEHLPNSMLEIFVPENFTRKESPLFERCIDIAAKHGVKIDHCRRCRFYGCRCVLPITIDGDKYKVDLNRLSDEEIDKTNITYRCRTYQYWSSDCKTDNDYLVWRNISYTRKPVKIPTNINCNIDKDKLLSIVEK